ncbi:hypothetical protein RKD40_000663 [Streptomyces ambofaciens]
MARQTPSTAVPSSATTVRSAGSPQSVGEPALAPHLVQGPQQGAALREQGDTEHDQSGHIAA